MRASVPITRVRARAYTIPTDEGLAATAISAIDLAIYDLKSKILQLPLAALLGRYRSEVPIYGSGGFTSYDDKALGHQLSGWVERGCAWVKMKVGRDKADDARRVAVAKGAIEGRTLFVDANGAYSRKQALRFAEIFACHGVTWFEEPLSSDDLNGLHFLRDRLPSLVEIAAGEYEYTIGYFETMLAANAVDVQQADITRCGGITPFLLVAGLCQAHRTDLSCHCAPAAHLHAACAAPRIRRIEWFHDHVRIERMLFAGAPIATNGTIRPDMSRPGLGLAFKAQDGERYAA